MAFAREPFDRFPASFHANTGSLQVMSRMRKHVLQLVQMGQGTASYGFPPDATEDDRLKLIQEIEERGFRVTRIKGASEEHRESEFQEIMSEDYDRIKITNKPVAPAVGNAK